MTVAQGEDDEALMVAYARDGSRAAFEELFGRYASRLHAFFMRQIGSSELSQDLVQQTFLHLHRARRDFDPKRALRPWLYTIALNVRREHFRRAGRRKEVALDSDRHPEPTTGPDATTAAERLLRRALEGLRDSQREVILLHYYQDLSFPEIAAVLGASLTAVKVRAHRGYEALRAALARDT